MLLRQITELVVPRHVAKPNVLSVSISLKVYPQEHPGKIAFIDNYAFGRQLYISRRAISIQSES